MLLMGKSTISTGPCSIAFCMFTRPGSSEKKQKNMKQLGMIPQDPQVLGKSGVGSLATGQKDWLRK